MSRPPRALPAVRGRAVRGRAVRVSTVRVSVALLRVGLLSVALLSVGLSPVVPTPTPAAAARPAPAPGGRTPGERPPPAVNDGVHIVKSAAGPNGQSCSGYSSQTTPPASVRVLRYARHSGGAGSQPIGVVAVPFEQYVENTLPNEWIASWHGESIKSGAVAVKSYAWYWVNHYGGYFNTPANCFDVTDDTSFQVYLPNTAQVRTNNAVQQTWNVVARDGSHAVRQASYLAYLTSAGSGESCGAGHNGSQLSQWGSQACAAAGLTYAQILHTYYDPGLELATIRSGPVSAPPSGPVVLASSGVLVAYRTSAGNVLGASQPAPGSAFGRWSVINQGPQFAGQPAALLAVNRTLVVYALGSGGHLLGDGQPRPGAAFTGWRVMGVGSPTLRSDPTPLLAANGALVIYATASDGNVWGIGQSRPGSAFSRWIRLSNTGGFTGRPAALVTAAHQIVVYARHGATIAGAGQAVAGGRFSAFADLGSGSPSVTGDPSAMQAADGTLAVYSVAAAASAGQSSVTVVGQPAPGTSFGAWRTVSAASAFSRAPAAQALGGAAPIVLYAVNGSVVQGAQAPTPASAFSPFGVIGQGTPRPAGRPFLQFAANGAIVLYVLGSDGLLWGCGQSQRGSTFGAWGHIGS